MTMIDSVMLARVGGDRELLAEVVALFLEDAPLLIQSIRTALVDQDCKAVAMGAHSLAGTAANFDADEVTTLARELEAHARADDLASSNRTFEPLAHAVLRLQERLAVLRTALQCAS